MGSASQIQLQHSKSYNDKLRLMMKWNVVSWSMVAGEQPNKSWLKLGPSRCTLVRASQDEVRGPDRQGSPVGLLKWTAGALGVF